MVGIGLVVSRLVGSLAQDGPWALRVIRAARTAARERACALAVSAIMQFPSCEGLTIT